MSFLGSSSSISHDGLALHFGSLQVNSPAPASTIGTEPDVDMRSLGSPAGSMSKALTARMDAMELQVKEEIRTLIIRFNNVTEKFTDDPNSTLTTVSSKLMAITLPPHSLGLSALPSLIQGTHNAIMKNLAPNTSSHIRPSFFLYKSSQATECSLSFLLEALFHGLDILPMAKEGGAFPAHQSDFRFVEDNGGRLGSQMIPGIPERFKIDVEVEYRGESKDHGSRFFTLYDLKLGDSVDCLMEDILEVDKRMRMAISYGRAQVSMWAEGNRQLERGDTVDLLWKEGSKALLQCVVHPGY